MSSKNASFEMVDNECYSATDSNVLAAKAPVPVKKNRMKCFMVAIVMATILNFLLVIGIGAALFYFQTNLTAEVSELTQDDEGQSGMAGYEMTGQKGEPGEKGDRGQTGLTGATGSKGSSGQTGGGANYIRWGRTTCPDTEGTELIYSGRTTGAHFQQSGSGSNYLCLTDEPEFLDVSAGEQTARSLLYGAEYEAAETPPAFSAIHNHNVPCATCYTSVRGDKVMVPGTIVCPSSWTREYYGYLMAEHSNHHRSTFECVDVNAESVPGSAVDTNGVLFYFTEMRDCAGISCPPYTSGDELTCAVCTK